MQRVKLTKTIFTARCQYPSICEVDIEGSWRRFGQLLIVLPSGLMAVQSSFTSDSASKVIENWFLSQLDDSARVVTYSGVWIADEPIA